MGENKCPTNIYYNPLYSKNGLLSLLNSWPGTWLGVMRCLHIGNIYIYICIYIYVTSEVQVPNPWAFSSFSNISCRGDLGAHDIWTFWLKKHKQTSFHITQRVSGFFSRRWLKKCIRDPILRCFFLNCWLLVGPPLWKIWSSIGMISNPIYGNMGK